MVKNIYYNELILFKMKKIGIFLLFGILCLNAQNVGIGTAVPARKLHVAGDMRLENLVASSSPYTNTTRLLIRLNTGDIGGIPFNGNVNTVLRGNGTFGNSPGLDSDWFKVGTWSSPKSIYDNIYTYGNVIIGNPPLTPATPLGKLDIRGKDNTVIIAMPADFKLLYRDAVASQYGFRIDATHPNSYFWKSEEGGHHQVLYFGDGMGNFNIFGISSRDFAGPWQPQFVVNHSGGVGIGTNNPQGSLHIRPVIDAGPNTSADGASLVIGDRFGVHLEIDDNEIHAMNGTAGSSTLYLNSNGGHIILAADNSGNRVGIGVAPSFLLHVNGSAAKPGGGSWINASDKRLKTNIVPYRDGLREIMNIRPVWYNYNGRAQLPTEKRFVGVIAQELQETAPYMVGEFVYENPETGEKENYLSVDNSAMTYMLVNAVKELARKNQKLQEENNSLYSRLKEISERLSSLEAKIGKETP